MDVGGLAVRVVFRQAGSPPAKTARMAILRPAYPADLSRRCPTPFLPLAKPLFRPSCAPTRKSNFLAISRPL